MRVAWNFLIILIPLLIILGNFQYLIFNFNYYQNLYNKIGVYESFNSPNIVDDATINLFGYFRDKNELDHNFFSTQAILHLGDVKNLLKFESGFFYLSLTTVLVISSIFVIKKQYKRLASSFLISSIITIITVVLLSFGLFKAFDWIFTGFHRVLFDNQLWLFPPGDNLIKLFPAQFFASFANSLALNIVTSSAVIALATGTLVKRILK